MINLSRGLSRKARVVFFGSWTLKRRSLSIEVFRKTLKDPAWSDVDLTTFQGAYVLILMLWIWIAFFAFQRLYSNEHGRYIMDSIGQGHVGMKRVGLGCQNKKNIQASKVA